MRSLVDTDVAIDFLDGVSYALGLFERLLSESKPLLSIVSYAEIREGVLRSSDPLKKERELKNFLSIMILCDFDRSVADVAAGVRHDLRSRGKETRRRALDLLIAATAITHDAALVTRNISDYRDINGLILYPLQFASVS